MKKHFHILAYCPQKGKFATVFSDITEQKRAEEALHESEEKFRTIASAAQDAVVVIDNEGKISYWNKAAEKMLGYTEGEVIGKNFHNLIVPKRFRATHFSAFPKFQKTGKGNAIGKTLKLAALTKNRDEIPVELSLSTTKFKGKWCAIGIMRDITERKRAEEELKASKEKLKEKNKELERIVYVASHDMRTPLVTIAGFSNELEISTKKIISILKSKKMSKKDRNKELSYIIEEDIPSSIRFIISGINKIQMMLDALLAYSRSGRSELEFEEVNMKETIEEIVASTKFDIEKTGAEIEIGKLPHCLADRIKVNQIFSNLIENAIKFFDLSRPGKIKISGKKNGKRVTYCVEDNGIGIPAEKIDEIFMVFFQIDSSSNEGEGIGLSTVKKLVERHGGRMWVESEYGKGSKFFVELPAV